MNLTKSSKSKVIEFLNNFRDLLDNHKAKITCYGGDIEIYIDGIGYVGYLEDDEDQLNLSDGENILFKSKNSSNI